MLNPIYVTGHKNPDTDAIVSSIAYAEYKRLHGFNAIAGRVGPVRNDTEYLLERFRFDDPLHLYTAKCTIREIDYDKAVRVSKDITIKEALNKLLKTASKTIFVTDKKKHLEGIVSLSNLNELWTADDKYLQRVLKTAKFDNIVKILRAEVLNRASDFKINGRLEIAPTLDSEIHVNDIVITSSERIFKDALKSHAGLVIVIGHFDTFDKLREEMKRANVNVIKTNLNALKISKLIYQTPSIECVMVKAGEVVTVSSNETVDACLNKISKTRYRSYPIKDENGLIVGSVSRYHLNNYLKKQLILVDHNEKKQSIEDIDFGEIVEIVDHHRLGDLVTNNPITICTEVVGATATIIAKKFFSENIKLNKCMAGLLLGAILSDTMNFTSPTTTSLDIELASKLEEVSGVKSDELYEQIVKHGESLLNRKSIDILYEDYKEFDISGFKIGISQATCKDSDEYFAVKDSIKTSLEDNCKTASLDLMLCMMTDTYGAGSFLLAAGNKKDVLKLMYPEHSEDKLVSKLVSRKKQLLPDLIEVLS